MTQERTNWRIHQDPNIKERNIFGSLLAAHDSETNRNLTQEELIAEAGLFIIAGSDTTGSAITATIFYVLNNKDCYLQLQKEIIDLFSHIEDIHTATALHQCHYLQACITEAIRLSPGVSSILPREVLDSGMKVDGIMFAAGTDISVASYAIHHNDEYYPEPFIFRPTRWLLASQHEGGVTPHELQVAISAYAPLSVGRANCLGRNLAYQEIMTVIARLIYQYEMRVQPGSTLGQGRYAFGNGRHREHEFQTWDRFISYHEGPMVEYRPRGLYKSRQ